MMQHRALFHSFLFYTGRRHLSQVGREGAHKGDRYLRRLEEDEGRGRSPGRKGAPQLPSADADEARLYIGLLLGGKLYHHLQDVGMEEEDMHLLLVHTDHLTSRAQQGAILKIIGDRRWDSPGG